jgi:hypothetical protein
VNDFIQKSKKLTEKIEKTVIYQRNFCFYFINQFISSRASGDIMNNRRCSVAEPPDSSPTIILKPCKGDIMNTKQLWSFNNAAASAA